MPISCMLIEQSLAENTNSQTGSDVCISVSNSVFHYRLGPQLPDATPRGVAKLSANCHQVLGCRCSAQKQPK